MTSSRPTHADPSVLVPHIARPALEWAREAGAGPEVGGVRAVEGSMVFGDVSGFTRMSERLARHGKVGAEEVAGAIDACFEDLLGVAYRCGGSLLKFGGDAVLLLFTGEGHAVRAAHAAVGMRHRLRTVGRIDTSAGRVVLRISMGAHSGTFHLGLVGGSHRELMAVGPGVSATVEAEGRATAGEIVMTDAMAAQLPARCRGPARPGGHLLRRPPVPVPDLPIVRADANGIDVGRYVPRAVREHLLGGGREPEHRTATVAFLHVDGTDGILAAQGPEVLARRLDATVRVAQDAADGQSICFLGTDVDHDGAKILLAAGAPRRLGGDEQRMLLALRAVVDSDDADVLPVRIGVHRGPVFAGEVGPPYRRTYTTMGDTVNLAARLMARAEPGQILATAGVLDRSEATFVAEPLAPFLVKGKRRPVHAFSVGDLRRVRRQEPDLLPMTGREAPLRLLREALAGLAGGRAAVVQITGGHGMGKTRLLGALDELARPVPVVAVTCERYDATTPYALAGVVGRRLLGLAADAGPSEVTAALGAALGDGDAVALVGTALGLDLPDTPATAVLEPEFRRRAVERATARFVADRMAAPSVLVVEDAHHMDEPSQGVVRAVRSAVSGTGVLLCVTRRDEPGGLDLSGDGVPCLDLEPLDVAQAVAALEAATDDAPLRSHEARMLAERSMGNPLFLTELLRAHLDGAAPDGLPDTVDGAVTAEIDRLAPRQRLVLRSAAVFGTSFLMEDLEVLLADDPDDGAGSEGDTALETWASDLAPFVDVEPSGRAHFRSTTLRDCAYEGLAYRRRRHLHARAAAALLERSGEGADAEAALLSLHCFEAHDHDGAWRWARLAGDRSLARFANHEAAVLYERAVAAGRRTEDLAPADLAATWIGLGDARERCGEYAEAARAYGRARTLLAGDAVAQAELCLRSAWIPERSGRYPEAVRWIRRGLALVEHLPGSQPSRVRAQLWGWYASVRQAQGASQEAVRWCEQAVAEARRSGDLDAEAHALFILDWAWVTLGRPDLAVHSPRALAIYRQLGDVGRAAAVLQNLGGFAYFRGEWDEALDLYRQGRDARLATGNEVDAAMGTANIGEILLDQGRTAEAAEQLHQALRVSRAAGYRLGVGFSSMQLGRLDARTGETGQAHDRLAAARREFAAAGLDADVVQVDVATVECLVMECRSAEALALADRLAPEAGAAAAALWRLRAEALLQQGDLDGAREALASARAEAEAHELGFEVLQAAATARRCARAEGDAAAVATWTAEIDAGCRRLGIVDLPDVPEVPA